ncbi:MAG: NADH-quinone oxidoreductase subunit NuoH [Desulfohalobiaceae bacterium]|nr:NADH-quinone oxidoreductase subunit NuoH [Desulfohalobiaceae bacterium]
MWTLGLFLLLTKLTLTLSGLLLGSAYLVLLERKLLGRMQIRFGPTRAGPYGLLQPIADGIKLLLKEDTVPVAADRFIFKYAPALVALVPLLIVAVIPFGRDLSFQGRRIPMVLADLNVGLLYVLAVSSLSVYGVALGAWASNSKYSLLGSLRGAAQLVSYELPLALSLVPVVMMAGSFSLVDIVAAQARCPFIVYQPLAGIIFLCAAVAEAKRLPFDLPEGENDLAAGYHTEYSGMRFALYFLGEYMNMIVLGSLFAVFFLGGWHGPVLPPLLWFLIKVMLIPFFLIWSRASMPRPRYDQLMRLGWKLLLPAALLNIVLSSGLLLWMGG